MFHPAAKSRPATTPKPRITGRGLLAATGLWTLYALYYAMLVAYSARIPYAWALSSMALSTAIMAFYSLPAWWVIIRELDTAAWPTKLVAHAVSGPLYSIAWYLTYVALFRLIFGEEILQLAQLRENRQWLISSTFMVYLVQFAIFHIIRSLQRLRETEEQTAELQTLAREMELTALRAQINPHFLFNTLNSISAMVTRNPEESRRMISQLAELLRYALDSSQRQMVPLRDELYFVNSYLDLESKRLGNRLEVEEDAAPEVLDVAVPPMILQPLVENAVRHGIAPSKKGGKIALRIRPAGSKVEFSVEDTGTGVAEGSLDDLMRNGVGLRNTDGRLRRLFGSESGLNLEQLEPRGFRVSFSIPLNQPERHS